MYMYVAISEASSSHGSSRVDILPIGEGVLITDEVKVIKFYHE